MIRVLVEGADKSGKGLAVAFLTHQLRASGIEVQVVGEETHNAKTLLKDDADLIARLKAIGAKVQITEMQTAL